MRTTQKTIRQMTKSLNCTEEGDSAPFFLPAIQRDFVWKEDQIARLFDSVMRGYPIGTLLAWKTKSPELRVRDFVANYRGQMGGVIPPDGKVKNLILDGQQRLQSFFIGLTGSYKQKELYFDVLSGRDAPPDDIRYRFEFRKEPGMSQWVKFKDLVNSEEIACDLAKSIIQQMTPPISEEQESAIHRNVELAQKLFAQNTGIIYQIMDSVEYPKMFRTDDVVEVFIRANSGGTKLSKSDLMFSLLVSEWDGAREQMDELLQTLNQGGYDFSRDFILKSCLALLGLGAKYDVEKFRKNEVREEIAARWDNISKSVQCVRDFLHDRTFIRHDKAMSSYLGLIPAIYFHYKYPGQWDAVNPNDFRKYIGRTMLARSFSGNPDSLIDAVIRRIDERQNFDIQSVFQDIRKNGRSVDFPKSSLLGLKYGDAQLHLVFNLWYPGVDYHPAYAGNLLQVDHIFPKSLMKENKIRAEQYNRIGNCMLLTAYENGPAGKGDQPPDVWFRDERGNPEYLGKHLIPKKSDLWRVDKFAGFLEERESMIVDKFRDMLVWEDE